jgi:hypothetical protein
VFRVCCAFHTSESSWYGQLLHPTQVLLGGGNEDVGVVREPGPTGGAPDTRDAEAAGGSSSCCCPVPGARA